MSPLRQVFFLLGLMLTSPEPTNPKDFGTEGYEESVAILNRLNSAYAEMYWPEQGELSEMPKEWRHQREVSMGAFLHYFNVLIIASVEQLRDRIQKYLVPFDTEIKSLTGLKASEVLDVANWISQKLQEAADELGKLRPTMQAEYKARLELLKEADREGWDIDRLRSESLSGDWGSSASKIMSIIDGQMKFDPDDLQAEFGKRIAKSYLSLFASKRGEVAELTYPTEQNPAERKPLFHLVDGRVGCPSANMLYIAANNVLEDLIRTSTHDQAFLRNRDRVLEEHVSYEFARVFKEAELFLENVYETPKNAFEHDLVILWRGHLLVIEAKASPPIEPFRDPERAFVRIRDSFRSETGIQGAFNQAIRLHHELEEGISIQLYDSRGRQVASIEASKVAEVIPICVTRDDFGALAVDLTFLLEKEASDPFPWAVNVNDLAYLIDAWEYFDWGPDELVDYLLERNNLHGLVLSSDELEIAGFHVEHGGLETLLQQSGKRTLLSVNYSDVFDRVYATSMGGPPVVYSPSPPKFHSIAENVLRVSPN
ncbi:MAG: hypothetical protein IIA89_07620 [Chloroflexi bacterium]|nr:hypothetical protein [Chloroflexota bacterium]